MANDTFGIQDFANAKPAKRKMILNIIRAKIFGKKKNGATILNPELLAERMLDYKMVAKQTSEIVIAINENDAKIINLKLNAAVLTLEKIVSGSPDEAQLLASKCLNAISV